MRNKTFKPAASALISCALVAGLAMTPVTASASNTKAQLNRVQVDSQGQRILINLNKALVNPPACHDNTKRLALPMSNPASKMLLATMLTAVAGKKDVRVVGTGFCSADGIETIEQVHIYP